MSQPYERATEAAGLGGTLLAGASSVVAGASAFIDGADSQQTTFGATVVAVISAIGAIVVQVIMARRRNVRLDLIEAADQWRDIAERRKVIIDQQQTEITRLIAAQVQTSVPPHKHLPPPGYSPGYTHQPKGDQP